MGSDWSSSLVTELEEASFVVGTSLVSRHYSVGKDYTKLTHSLHTLAAVLVFVIYPIRQKHSTMSHSVAMVLTSVLVLPFVELAAVRCRMRYQSLAAVLAVIQPEWLPHVAAEVCLCRVLRMDRLDFLIFPLVLLFFSQHSIRSYWLHCPRPVSMLLPEFWLLLPAAPMPRLSSPYFHPCSSTPSNISLYP